jgi:hypothetical protein
MDARILSDLLRGSLVAEKRAMFLPVQEGEGMAWHGMAKPCKA